MSGFSKTKKAVADMPNGSRKELLTNLVKKAEFISGELVKLEAILKEKGWVEEYQNGQNQHGLKKSSEGDVYNQLIKNFAGLMQKILDCLPDDSDKGKDELEMFLARKNNVG